MKCKSVLFILLICGFTGQSQSWQWGKRGGSLDHMGSNGRQEEVYSIATDTENNIYTLSTVGNSGLDIDGNPKTYYGDPTTKVDIAISSFACDGTYRWSKIIGGPGLDVIDHIKTDAEGNVYVAGRFGGYSDPQYQQHFDEEVIFPASPVSYQNIFLIKYSSDGVLQWYRKPQAADVTHANAVSHTGSYGMATDPAGNCYWLVRIPPGIYAGGEFVNTIEGDNSYVLKYGPNGMFVSATLLDMQLTGTGGAGMRFYRNGNTGNFYVTATKLGSSDTVTIGGESVTHNLFLACFSPTGSALWKRENTSNATNPYIRLYNLDFDQENNIYLGGRIVGLSMDSFLGVIVPEARTPGFIMKVNSTAENLIWSSYHNKDTSPRGAIIVNGDEIGYTSYCHSADFTWGDQVLNANNNGELTEVLLARFNKTTGACIGLVKIPGDPGYDDVGTALVADSSGDYILGGGFGHHLTINGNTLVNEGSQSDFFVAKYATSPCSLDLDEEPYPSINVYPNPVRDRLNIPVFSEMSYSIYSTTGQLIAKGIMTPENNTVDSGSWAAGIYMLHLADGSGKRTVTKLVKQ